jgi:hypothetical protein
MGRALRDNSFWDEFAVFGLVGDRRRVEISPVHARLIPTFVTPCCLDLSHACKAGKTFPES